jgi:hypothetical protein
MHHLRPVEQPALLLRVEPVLDVAVLKDLGEAPTTGVFPDHVRSHTVLRARGGEQKREGAAQQAPQSLHRADCILGFVKRKSTEARFAERMLAGVDDQGREERVVIWIERKTGALWGVGRAVNPHQRSSPEPRRDDYVFEGYELEDALEAANATLEDDVRVLEQDGRDVDAKPFVRDELLKPLERWFFGR